MPRQTVSLIVFSRQELHYCTIGGKPDTTTRKSTILDEIKRSLLSHPLSRLVGVRSLQLRYVKAIYKVSSAKFRTFIARLWQRDPQQQITASTQLKILHRSYRGRIGPVTLRSSTADLWFSEIFSRSTRHWTNMPGHFYSPMGAKFSFNCQWNKNRDYWCEHM